MVGLRLCLDPGHGGSDPGCVAPGFVESEWVLDVTLRTASFLLGKDTAWKDRLTFTRLTGERGPGLYDRARCAHRYGARLTVAVHCNSTADEREHGPLVFYQGGSMTGMPIANTIALALASRGGEYVDGDKVRPMLRHSLAAKPSPHWSGRAYNVMEPHGARCCVVVEPGYASNAWERAWLLSEDGRDQVAAAIAAGVLSTA